MSYWNQQEPYVVDKPIIAFADGMATPYNVTVYASDIQANVSGVKVVPAGMFVAETTAGYFRFLPRTTVAAAFATNSTGGTLNVPHNTFKAGDVLSTVDPFAKITLSGTFAANDTVTVTLASRSSGAITVGSTTIATIATNLANALNSIPNLAVLAYFIATTDGVYVYGKDGVTAHSLAVATSGSGTVGPLVGASATLSTANVTIGTISSISSAGVVVLTGNAAVAVPVGARVGMRVLRLVGVLPRSIDFTNVPAKLVAPVIQAHGVYENALPYCDELIKQELNNLFIGGKF